jgi:hypothetical protein
MRAEDLTAQFPRLYHMAEDGSWPSIQTHGLLSTKALLDLFEVGDVERERVYSHHRPESVTIRHQEYGVAVVRDQKPMDDKGLIRSLGDGINPRQWYEMLNDRVFFWLSETRLERHLSARAYRDKSHTVLTIDTERLVHLHVDRITLSPINSGCTKPMPQPRGANTFLPISSYPFDYWVRKRGLKGDPVVELAVNYSVPDIAAMTLQVDRRAGPEIIEQIWP